jgi:hypothetical protein
VGTPDVVERREDECDPHRFAVPPEATEVYHGV